MKSILQILALVLLVAGGLGVRSVLISMKNPPLQAEVREPALQVEVVRAVPEDVPVIIRGYGEVRPAKQVPVSPLVSGEIVEVHPQLEAGAIIPRGTLLFRIDPSDYAAAVTEAEANVALLENTIERLKAQQSMDHQRLNAAMRMRDLSRTEYDRTKALFEDNNIASESHVNQAELSYTKAKDDYERLKQAVDLYPYHIQEAEDQLKAAKARLTQAKTRLERTEVRAGFNARVVLAQLEAGQFVAPGAPVLTLANDEELEIEVSLDSRDVRSWLLFKERSSESALGWFGEPEPVTCQIAWTEDPDDYVWEGTLERIERVDQRTRTVTVSIRAQASVAGPEDAPLPLVEGMFCSVAIPGKDMTHVFRLPRWAADEQAYVAESSGEDGQPRLSVRDVSVLRGEGEEVFVASGLEPGDLVIVTRLADPLPDTLLEYTVLNPSSSSSAERPPS